MIKVTLILSTLLLASCSDSDPFRDFNNRIEMLEMENASLRTENRALYFQASYRPICMENKIKQGCLNFKNNLASQDVKLTADQWVFCDKYKDNE